MPKTRAVRARFLALQPYGQPRLVLADFIQQQADRAVAVRHNDIRVAVVVDVAKCCGATDLD